MKIVPTVLFAGFLYLPFDANGATIFAGVGNDGYYRDVQGIYSALQNMPGWSNVSDYYMRENLTGSAIREFITGFQSVLQPSDTLIWYYSGHGGWISDSNGDETAVGAFSKDNYDETVGIYGHSDELTDDGLSQAFSSLVATGSTLITLFDTCYAGGFVGGVDDLNSVPGLTFLGSSSEVEESYSIDDQPYSIFTQGLINGLEKFHSDPFGDEILLAGEWFDFASEYTISHVNNQYPVFYGNEDLLVSVPTAVPLPGTLWFLGSGLASLIAFMRKRNSVSVL